MTLSRILSLGLVIGLLAACGGDDGDDAVQRPLADTALEEPIRAEVSLASGLNQDALVGQPFSGRVVVVANDVRNRVTALSIANPTASGATPTVDAGGSVTWVPNEIDYEFTRELRLTVQVATGLPQTLDVPVDVAKQRLVLEATLPIGAGTLADAAGRYQIRVDPVTAGSAMSGMLRVVETYYSTGNFRFTVSVPTTSNARATILDAPRSYRASSVAAAARTDTDRMRALATGDNRIRPLAKSAADGLLADVGGALGDEFLSGDFGHVANAGQVNVYTTRNALFYYRRTSESLDYLESPKMDNVFQIDANCTTALQCRAIRSADGIRRSPVILVHGFNLLQSVGGGDGTWGALARTLTDRGHPVFELRWNTYMRFEEAAGVLATLSRRVAELTEHKVMVIAHSFGGVVAHTAAMGKGIRFGGSAWNTVDVDGVFGRMLTLGAPLSGIRYVPSPAPINLTGGRDAGDGSITICEAITCYQAGSSDEWDSPEITELVEKVSAIDPARAGLPDRLEGATIRALHDAWRGRQGHAVPFSTVVSLKKRPFDAPDRTNATAHDLGDGLISIMGQSVVPEDFANKPFDERTGHDILGRMGPDFLTRLDAAHAINMVKVPRDNNSEYFFALRAAHSPPQNSAGSSYKIAFYPADGKVETANEPVSDHPLNHFIRTGTTFFAAAPVAYSGPVQSPTAVVRGRTMLNGSFIGGEAVSFQIETAVSGVPISDVLVRRSSWLDGSFSFDAGRVLAERYPGQFFNAAGYKVVVRAGDGLSFAKVTLRQALAADVNIGDIDLSPATTLVNASGSVIDGQTQEQAVAGVDVFLMKGLFQLEAFVRQVTNTTTSRRLVTDSTGRFSVAGLQPGLYTVVVSKDGYHTQSQGTVRLSTTGANMLSFSLLRVLQENAASITLRWGDRSTGQLVSPDLDAHLRKYNASDAPLYHIYFNDPIGSSTDSLDRDDFDYVGPETITLTLDNPSRYLYYVNNYAAENGSTIGGSSPTVIVRIGAELQEFSLPIAEQSTARYWRVFDVVNGRIVPCATACLSDIEPQ